MAPVRRARPSPALVAVLLLAAFTATAAAEDAAAAAAAPPRKSKPAFGHLPRTRYPKEAQSWRATPPGAPVFGHLARGDVLSALNSANSSSNGDSSSPRGDVLSALNSANSSSNGDSSSPIPKEFSWCDVGGASLCAPSWQQHNAAMSPPGARYCGSCFLHATLSAVQDRIKGMRHLQALKRRVQASSSSPSSPAPPSSSSNAQDVILGRQAFLNCAPLHGFSKGCNGGEPLDVYHYMSMHGLPDEGCVPYSATDHTRFKKKKGGEATNDEGDGGDAPASSDAAPASAAEALRQLRGGDSSSSSDSSDYLLRGDPKCRGPKRGQRQCQNCMPLPEDPKQEKKEEEGDDDGPIPAECWAVERPVRYGLRAFGKVPQGEESIQREILARGPVVCGIACPEKFVYGYRSGVYVDDQKDKELDHDVEIVGWGEVLAHQEQLGHLLGGARVFQVGARNEQFAD
jgi:hypothetical protein